MRRAGRADCSLCARLFCFYASLAIVAGIKYGVPIEINYGETGRTPLKQMVDVTNEFGLKVLAQHNFLNDNNIAFSPYGLIGIMVALFEGVDGDSSYEIQRAMQLPWNRNVMRVGFRDIHRTLKTYFVPEEGFLAGLALNSDNVVFKPKYIDVLRFYGFDIESGQTTTTTSTTPNATVTTIPTTTNVDETSTTTLSTENTTSDTEETTSNPSESSTTEIPQESTTTSTQSTPTSTTVTTTTSQTTLVTSTTEMTTPTNASSPNADSNTSTTPNTTISENIISTTENTATDTTNATTAGASTNNSTTAITSTEMTSSSGSTTTTQSTTTSDSVTSPSTSSGSTQNLQSESTTESVTPSTETLTNGSSTTTQSSSTSESGTTSTTTSSSESTTSIQNTTTPGNVSLTTEATPSSDSITNIQNSSTTESATPSTDSSSPHQLPPHHNTTLGNVTPSSETMSTSENKLNNTESVSIPTHTSGLGSLVRKKKSIVDYLFTYPPYAESYPEYRSFDIGPEFPDLVYGGDEQEMYFADDAKKIPPPVGYGGNQMFLANGIKNVEVTYMSYDATLDYAHLPHLDASALRLPLDSDRYYLLLVLPTRRRAGELGRLLSRMARSSDLSDVYNALRPKRVRALVPSFFVKGHIALTTDLQRLGIRNVFQPRQNDFTPMTSQAGVYVRSIEQAVSVAIRKYSPDETKKIGHAANRQKAYFSATYPFLYFVMDANINVALMAGKLVDPLNSRIL